MRINITAVIRRIALPLAWLVPLALWQPCHAEAVRASKPFNRVVIGVDTSGSYKKRAAEAIVKARSLLDGMAKRRVRRWEASDQIVVISLDAIPEVVWEGTTKELASVDPATWTKRFQGRADYSACTDVERFFALSASKLSAEPAPVEKYLVVFSDLIAEPPLDSPKKCSRPLPAAQVVKAINWDQFSDVSTVVFWMPIAMKHAWLKALADQGANTGIRLYSESESGGQTLEAPQAAKRKVSVAEREQVKEQVVSAGTTFLTFLAYSFGLLIAGTAIAFALGRLLRSRRGGTGISPMNGRVPPLVLPRNARPVGARPAQANRPNRGM
jgi:hypothetical protein